MAIVTSLCQTLGASPTKNRKSHGGEYLVLVASHANLIAAATYQTGTTAEAGCLRAAGAKAHVGYEKSAGMLARHAGMAANPIVSQKALDILGVDYGFGRWLISALVPSLLAAAVLPWSMRAVSRPSVDVGAVRAAIATELRTYASEAAMASGDGAEQPQLTIGATGAGHEDRAR